MAISKAAAIFRKTGDTLDVTPVDAIGAGDIIVESGVTCIALSAIPANTSGELKILQRGEVIEITTDEAIGVTDAGAAIYVTPAGLVTKDADDGETPPTAYKLLGYTSKAVGEADLTFAVVCA